MTKKFDQLVRFATDSVGIERTLRLLQATAHILASYTFPLECLLFLLNTLSTAAAVENSGTGKPYDPFTAARAVPILLALRTRLNLVRRHFRAFRWLEAFGGAQKTWETLSSPSPPLQTSEGEKGRKEVRRPRPSWTRADLWLDVFGKTFNGMYLLIDATVIPDALDIEGFGVWGAKWTHVTTESQKFWFLALVCGAAAGLVRIAKVLVYTPVPQGYGFPGDQKKREDERAKEEEEGKEEEKTEKTEKTKEEETGEEDEWDLKREQARLRDIVSRRKLGRRAWRREVSGKISALGRKTLADALDTILPGFAVGWVPVRSGTVGVAMFVTTLLTGWEAWERCGREVGA